MSQKIRPNNEQKQGDILMSQANADIKAKNLRNTIFGGLDTTIPFGGYSYKARGFDKAATEGNWSKWSLPEDMAQKAYEEQDWKETITEMGIGFGKQFGAGFLDSIGAWDASNITQSTYRNGEIEYSNWFNQLGAKLKKSAQEENQIYQDPSGSMWNGAYFANQVQQLGYTGGIIAEMVAENILLNTLTGGTSATATTAKGARLFANIGKDALFGMAQGVKEAHMNALETQNTVFQKFKQLGYTDEEALAKSKEAANLHFKTESTALMGINALQNVMFLGSLSRGAKNIAKNAFNREGDKLSLGISDAFQNAGEKVIGAITPNKTVQKLTGWGLLAGSESIEEGVQTGIGVYASNKVQGKDTTLDDLMTHEMRDSMIGGALGGVLMGAGFKAIANYTNRDFNKNYKNFLEDSINFSHNTLRAEDEARKNYNQIVKEYEANPSESNAKKLLNFKEELEKAKHNSSVATAFMSLNFDYAKGTGSTVAFDMHVAHMQNVLEAVNTGNTEQLKNYGLLDEDTGKERFAGSLETIKNTYQDNIDNALQVKKFFSETLGEDTNDFKVASDIVLAKFNRFQTQKRNNKIDEELNTAYSADEVFKSLSSNSQKRFKLENELTGINKYVSDQDNPLVQQRKQEIKEELDNLPDYSTEEKAFISFDTSRDTGYATAYGNKMNLLLGINSATKEIAELSNPDNIKNRVKTSVEEALNKATTKEEIDSAIQEAKYHGVHTNKMDEVAKAKLKSIKASEAATKAAGVTTSTPKAQPVEPVTKPVEEKVEKPNPNMQKAVSILGGKKFETSGIESTVAETLDNAITANTESLAQDAFSDPNTAQELKDTFSDIYDELQDELGRIPTHDDLVRKFIKAYGKEEVKGYLPGLERASELLGKAITDTSYLFQSLEKGRNLLKNLISNNTPEKENPVNNKHIDDTPNKEIETVERGTGFGANKAAIYNDYNKETGNYRQAEYLPGLPEDNTLRYFLKPGDKLIMALAENYESIHVAIMDRRVPTNVGHSGRTMPFGEFMEWVTTDEATKYGYRKLEKNSPEWKTLWNNKVPMVYHLYNEQTGEPDLRVAALVHDVEWWHRNNVSQISEKDPITIAREGAESTAEERRRFFEEGKRIAEVTEVSQLGTEFYLVKQEADGSWVSNVDTGEMYITLEEATGATRLGVATASNKIKLEDGTELTIGEKHPNTEQPILLNTKSFSEGTIVEVRKIKDINGNPVYKAYTPIIDKAAKGQQLNDTTFNIVKYIILSRIYNKIQSEDIKNYLKTNYNIDVNSVQALENALKESRLGSLEGNIDEVVSNFIMTSNSINYSQKGNWTQLVLGKDFMKVYYKGKLQSINFNNTAEKSVSNIKEIENFLELLLGADNDGVLRNTTVDVKKEKLISKGQMFVVDSVGNVQPFQSLHGQNTYAGYLKSIVKTSVKSFPAKELGPNGETQWITDVQPMVYISNANVEQLTSTETGQPKQSVDINDSLSYEQQKAEIERIRQEELEYWQAEDRQKKIKEGRETTKKVLENLKNKYPSTTFQGIAIRLLEKIIDFNTFAIINSEGLKLPGGQDATKFGALATGEGMAMRQDRIDALLEGDVEAVKTFIHELVHTFTKEKVGEYQMEKSGLIPGYKAKLTEKEKKAVAELERIYNKVKQKFPSSTEYGLTNLDEFLAEAFSNVSFQGTLKELKSEGKTTSLFKEWLNAISDLFYESLVKWSKRFNKTIPQKSGITGILEDIMGWTEDLVGGELLKLEVTTEEINAKYDAELEQLNQQRQEVKQKVTLSDIADGFINPFISSGAGVGHLSLIRDEKNKDYDIRNIEKFESLPSFDKSGNFRYKLFPKDNIIAVYKKSSVFDRRDGSLTGVAIKLTNNQLKNLDRKSVTDYIDALSNNLSKYPANTNFDYGGMDKEQVIKKEMRDTINQIREISKSKQSNGQTTNQEQGVSSDIDINEVIVGGITYDKEGLELLREIDPEAYELLVNNSTHYFGESEARNEFETQPGELGNLNIPGITAKELNDVGAFLFNSVLGTIEQNDSNTIKPRLIYDRLMSSPEQFLFEKMQNYRRIAENLRANPKFNEAMEPIASRYETNANKLQSIIDNKKVITDVLKLQLDELLGQEFIIDSITEGYINQEGDYVNDVFNEDFGYGEQIETNYSKMSTEKDIRLTYSTALKIAFAGIQVKNHRGDKVSGEFDLPIFEDINFVSEIVKALIVGLPSNTNMMLEKLKEVSITAGNKQTANIASEMYNKIKNAPEHVKNEMLYKLAQQKLNMEMVIYSTDNKGRYTLKVQNTNSNADLFRIRDQWRVNFLKSSFVEANKDNEKVLNKEYLKNFYDRVKDLHTNIDARLLENEKQVQDETFQIFQDLGITIGRNTFDNIWDAGTIIKDKSGFFGILLRQIEPITKKEEELFLDKEDNRFLDSGLNSKLKVLAGVELVLNSTLATPSQRVAGKSYPGTSQRIMLDDITDQLFNTRSSLFTFLKGAAYSKRNFLLDIIENTDFLNNIENYYTRVSPIAIKEQGKKDFGDNSIDKIADSDNILTTLGFFQHSSKEKLNTTGTNFSYPSIAFRIGKMFSPALSDKGQMVAITTALLDLKKNNFNIEGNKVSLSDDVLDFMLVNLFDSEFDRIVYSYNNPTNIKGYEQANKFFNAIPAFNDIEVGESTLYEVLRETINNPDIEDKQAAFENIRSSVRYNAKEILNRIIEADLNTKIKNNEEGLVTGGTWVKAGILSNSEATENKPSEVALKYIDSKYVSSKEDADLNNLQKGKIAALDFIVNHYLFQSNIYQLYVGDMALYAPGAKKYLAKDGTLDSFNLSNETGQAITKRIASLIAPGNVLANSTLDNGMPAKYIQIFLNDVQAPSSIIEEYIKMVNDGKIPEDQKEHLENYKSKDPVVKNTAIDALKNMNLTIAEYFDIEGTDAQEYTTWQEHLDVLYGQGRITKEDKERFANNIKNDSLTDEDLKIILNPLKPVYAGMLQDTQNGVNRFVYVKSSSFPLLPQLTKGLKLDKVRIAMEKLQEEGQNVRMSYQTANKVGAVNTTLHMSDFYNTTPETLNDLIENKIKPNTLVLNRSSFKVQQDTPYKAKKYMEKNKDTQTTLGSQMFKNLMGAGINQMGEVFPNLFPQTILNELRINIPRGAMLTGPQLDSIKTLVETKYMELQSKNLENEIGIVPGQSYFTLPVEKKQQIFKNLIDVLKNEIKTRQYDKALLKELEIDETGLETTIPIWITNNADKFESLFLSIVKNRFISIKLPGNGHIVGSSEGFERIDTLDNLSGDVKSNIVWVDPNHTGDLKATYITTKDGKKVVSESEILVQSHYIVNVKDKTGKIVSKKINLLNDEYSTVNDKGERVLKLDKIDPELLSNFSFRIPTSAHQSGAMLKVVGFLPENSGDLLIVPDEHTKQIGEDFDIDKRYVYKSNYKINKETGKIEKISLDNIEELKNLIEEFKLSQDNQDTDRLVGALLDTNIGDLAQEIQNEIENLVGKSVSEITTKSNNLKNSILNKLTLAGLENAMIDTYKSVYQSPSEEVQKKIFRILSMDVAEKTANLIDSTINVVDKQNYTFLSDEVQRKQMKSGTSGKLGTAMHSNAVTFQAQMERLKDKLIITFKNENGETQNKEIRIGDLVSDGVLGITETLDGGREVNAVHAENQNSAVDNVKANIMAKRNENSYTMSVLIQLTFRRFDQVPVTRIVNGKTITTKEHLPSLFLAQPILRRYVELMEESKSITSEFSYNTEANIIEKLYKEFSTPGIDINDNVNYMSASKKMTGTELYNNLSGEPNNFVQAGVLRKFLELKAEAEELQDIQRVMSLSSSGLGKSYFDVIDRIERLNALPYSSIKNASKLIGIHTVYDAKLDLEDPEHYKGYIVLGDKAWKPTTSEGAMLLHSLKTAEQIMDINYPYNRNFISRTLNNIIAEKGTPLNANNTTEFKWKVLKSLKDFLQSDSDLNYFVGDIDAERKRLFGNEVTTGFVKTNYKVKVQENTHVKAINPKTGRLEDGIGTLIIVDNSKGERILHRAILGNKPVFNKFNQFVQNKNFVIKKEEDGSYTYHNYTQKVVKESLADYLHRIKQERDGRGNLIHPIFASNNLLKSLDIQLNDKYSNNISIIKHANVDAIDFNMLGKNEYFLQMLDDNTTNIGTWNGEQMTPRKLAQDLASYAYLSNQENGAIGFRQFIDTNYLKAIGYDKQLKQVLDKYDSSERIQNTFLKQYYQHNPEQARIISVNNITLDNIVRLDPETNKYRNTNQSPETKLNNILRNVKEFTLVDNDSNEIKTKFIAIRDTSIKYSDNQYRLFEYTGEGTGYVEIPVLGTFGYNEYNQNNYNQTSSLTNKEFSPISIFSGTVAGPDGLWDTFENNIETEDLNDFYNFDSVEVFANTVKQLALNSGVKETIELLEDYLDPRTKIEVINFNDVGRTGQGVYIHETNTILINSESIRQGLNSGLELSEVLERLNSIFTEELLHSVQVNALKQYGTTRIVDHGTHKENVFTPNSDAPVFVTKLVALYNEAKSVLPYVHGQENYESKDIFEFMAGAFDHRSEYRQKLDTIKDFKGKSLMDRFKEIVGQAIQFLTGNYSSEVKQTVIDLMNNTQDLRGRNIAKPVTTTIIKVEGTSSRPDISFVDKKDVQAELDSGGLVSDITELMKNIKDKSLITPENLLSLLQENNIIKKEC